MNAVLTGDSTNITPYIILMVVAVIVVIGFIVYKMKKIDEIKSTVIEQIDYLVNTSIEISF